MGKKLTYLDIFQRSRTDFNVVERIQTRWDRFQRNWKESLSIVLNRLESDYFRRGHTLERIFSLVNIKKGNFFRRIKAF